MSRTDRRITACIPYYGCGQYVRRAVECLLGQTHQNITVVVVNDGDSHPPWRWLTDIRDPRLVRFDLAGNYGPYLATAVVLNATSAPYFLIQDADDWSPPGRAACLLDRLERDGSDLAVSAQIHYRETSAGAQTVGVRWYGISAGGRAGQPFVVRPRLTPQFLYRAPHHGLFRAASIRHVGGYYGGFRVSYDSMLTNLILMTGRVSHIAQPLYYHLVRPGSLTQSPATGMKSRFRLETDRAIAALYERCYNLYLAYLRGKTDSTHLARGIRDFVANNIPAENARQLGMETARLKRHLTGAGIEPSE
jgi:glycosyltransferase involved in cell wall biosynthesis